MPAFPDPDAAIRAYRVLMHGGAPEPAVMPKIADRTPCVVSDDWALGGGPGEIRTRGVLVEVGEPTHLVEFDDAPGFWWIVPVPLVTQTQQGK